MLRNKIEGFNKIFVTGPARSGTHIGAAIISETLNVMLITEDDVGTSNMEDVCGYLTRYKTFVFQCPKLFSEIERFSSDDACIIVMMRPIDDILDSRRRVGFGDANTLDRYGAVSKFGISNRELITTDSHGSKIYERPLPVVQYDYWQKIQKKLIPHTHVLDYDVLSGHPLFVPKKERLTLQQSMEVKSTGLVVKDGANYSYCKEGTCSLR